MPELKKCCIDACIWVKYAGQRKVYVLLALIRQHNLIVYADNYLLAEIHSALTEGFNFSVAEADGVIRNLLDFIILCIPRNVYRLAGDPEDNYLYDICIQNNCGYLITIDKQIIEDSLAPFIRKTDAWLKKLK
jgi:predicted nucleic acid-binding protein